MRGSVISAAMAADAQAAICRHSLAPYDNRARITYVLQDPYGRLYVGLTRDLYRRVRNHNTGNGARYTARQLPPTTGLELVERAPAVRTTRPRFASAPFTPEADHWRLIRFECARTHDEARLREYDWHREYRAAGHIVGPRQIMTDAAAEALRQRV